MKDMNQAELITAIFSTGALLSVTWLTAIVFQRLE
jgi:hypothetical protein